jgi:CBS domain-containing protein
MLCGDVMWQEVPALKPEDTVRLAVRRLIEENVAALPVVDETGAFVGMVSERTLVRRVLAEDLDPDLAIVGLVVDRRVPTCEPEDPAAVALKRMDEANQRWIPVVREGRLLGVIGVRDIRSAARSEDANGLHSLTDAALRH